MIELILGPGEAGDLLLPLVALQAGVVVYVLGFPLIVSVLGWMLRTPVVLWGILVATMCFVCFALSQPRMYGFTKSKADIAGLATKKFATEAYPLWVTSHPGKLCPDHLDELNEWADSKDGKDPWGTHFRVRCGPGLEFAVISAGEDQRFDTDDDIRSWEQ